MKISAKTISVNSLIKKFGAQASKVEGSFGDRRLVGHLMGTDIPSTQAVFQAARVPGGDLHLIDGHKRLFRWMQLDVKARPFEEVVLVTHEVDATTLADLQSEMASLKRTIDSRDALNRPVDEYLQALVSAGFAAPMSRVYKRGVKAEGYFRRVVGVPTEAFESLVAKATEHKQVHGFMDILFWRMEKAHLRDTYLHPGIAVGLFQALTEAADPARLKSAILKASLELIRPQSLMESSGLSTELARIIREKATDAYRNALCRECNLLNLPAFYSECAAQLKQEILAALAAYRDLEVKAA